MQTNLENLDNGGDVKLESMEKKDAIFSFIE